MINFVRRLICIAFASFVVIIMICILGDRDCFSLMLANLYGGNYLVLVLFLSFLIIHFAWEKKVTEWSDNNGYKVVKSSVCSKAVFQYKLAGIFGNIVYVELKQKDGNVIRGFLNLGYTLGSQVRFHLLKE